MDGPMVHWWYKCDVVGLVGMFSNSHVSGQNVIFVHTIVGASLLMKWHLSDDEGLFWVCETVQSGEWGEVSFSEQGGGTKWPKFYTLGNETLTQENRCPYIPTPPGPPPIFHPQIKVRRVLIWKNQKFGHPGGARQPLLSKSWMTGDFSKWLHSLCHWNDRTNEKKSCDVITNLIYLLPSKLAD